MAIENPGCWSATSIWANAWPSCTRRMQVEALFRDAKGGGFEWELSRVLRAERAQRLPLGTPLAISCAVLLGEAAIRAGEIPAYGRSPHAVSLVRRGLDWLGAPARPRCFGGPSLHKKTGRIRVPSPGRVGRPATVVRR